MAALECVANTVCGEESETLGQLIKKHPDKFPAPLGDAVSKLYGFASEKTLPETPLKVSDSRLS